MGRKAVLLVLLAVIVLASSGCGLAQFASFVFTQEPEWKWTDWFPIWQGELVKGEVGSENEQQRNAYGGWYLAKAGKYDTAIESKADAVSWFLVIDYRLAPRVYTIDENEKTQMINASACEATTQGCYLWQAISPSGRTYVVRAERITGTENYNISVSAETD